MSANTAVNTAATGTEPSTSPRRIPVGSDLYNRLLECYYDEASMLDELRFIDWTGWLAKDLRYTCPQRMTYSLAEQQKTIVRSVMHFDESLPTIMARVKRLRGNSAFAEDPPSRTRRLITNMRVQAGETEKEYQVLTYFLLTRSRFGQTELMTMSGERRDIVRDLGDKFELVAREIILDQAVLGMPNLAVFL